MPFINEYRPIHPTTSHATLPHPTLSTLLPPYPALPHPTTSRATRLNMDYVDPIDLSAVCSRVHPSSLSPDSGSLSGLSFLLVTAGLLVTGRLIYGNNFTLSAYIPWAYTTSSIRAFRRAEGLNYIRGDLYPE